MFPGQPAASCGKLQIGDIVLEVNGQSLESATHQEAINLIRMGPPEVLLLIKRDPSSIPQSLLQRAGSNASDIDPAQLLADIQSRLRGDNFLPSKHSSDAAAKETKTSEPEPKEHSVPPALQPTSVPKSTARPLNVYSRNLSVESSSGPTHPTEHSPVPATPSSQGSRVEDKMSLPISLEHNEALQAEVPVDAAYENHEPSFGDEDSVNSVPLAEDELSDIEDSRRGSGPDILLPDDSNLMESIREKLSDANSQLYENVSLHSESGSVDMDVTLRPQSSESSESSDDDTNVQDDTAVMEQENGVEEQLKQTDSLTPQEEVGRHLTQQTLIPCS